MSYKRIPLLEKNFDKIYWAYLPINPKLNFKTINLNKISALWRGVCYRKNNLPNSIVSIKTLLCVQKLILSNKSTDGRTNSCIDEDIIIEELKQKYVNRLYVPETRHWFDCAIFDYKYGWLPINIKTTTTTTSDNTGNLAMCMYAITNYNMDLKKSYQNGLISKKLIEYLKNKKYNTQYKRDYYFVVINKNDLSIIINSVNGLTKLTPNINNLPFQVKWCDNQTFKYKKITDVIAIILNAIKKPQPSWREDFLCEIRQIE